MVSRYIYIMQYVSVRLYLYVTNVMMGLSSVFNDLIDDFTKSDFKLIWDNFEIFKIILKYGDLICNLIFKMSMKIKSQII
jgi:hypothetical protein